MRIATSPPCTRFSRRHPRTPSVRCGCRRRSDEMRDMKTAIAPGTDASPEPAPSHCDRRPDGPLPEVLLAMTAVTGLVDAFSYLSLGHVFVANMTGNVVFLGFGLAGAGGIAVNASLVAIAAFALGAAVGGRWALPRTPHRGRLLAAAAAVEAGLVVAAAVIA